MVLWHNNRIGGCYCCGAREGGTGQVPNVQQVDRSVRQHNLEQQSAHHLQAFESEAKGAVGNKLRRSCKPELTKPAIREQGERVTWSGGQVGCCDLGPSH